MTISELNAAIGSGQIEQVVAREEGRHSAAYGVVASKIATRGARVVLLSGPSSSGKTTSSMRIGVELEKIGLKALHISLDNYFVEREKTPLDDQGRYDFESLGAIDAAKFAQEIEALLDGSCVYLQKFDFKEGRPGTVERCVSIDPNTILIVEGLHALNPHLTEHIPFDETYKIYLTATTPVQLDPRCEIRPRDNILLRRMIRDHQYRGRSAAQTIEGWADVRRGEQQHILPFEDESDVVLDTSLGYEFAVLKPFVVPLLTEARYLHDAKRLLELLECVCPMDPAPVPCNSVIREYIGGSCFEY